MKTKIKSIIAAIALTSALASGALAQSKTKVSLEIDPVTFVFSGYSAHLRIQPKLNEHLLVGAGIYAINLPSAIVDFNKNNKDLGWNVRINQGYGLFGEYYFSEANRKWFLGAQASIQQYKIEKDLVEGDSQYNNVLFMAYGGYTFNISKTHIYVKPWAGIGYTSKLSGDNTLQGFTYDIAPITMFATFHIGYTF